MVHDPNNSLRTGDVVCIVPGWPTSKHKRHVVKHIVAPYGTPIEERAPIPSADERITERDQKKAEKDSRRDARRAAEKEASLVEKAARLKAKAERQAAKLAKTSQPAPTS